MKDSLSFSNANQIAQLPIDYFSQFARKILVFNVIVDVRGLLFANTFVVTQYATLDCGSIGNSYKRAIPTITMSPSSDYVSQPPTPVTDVVPTLDTVEPLYPSDPVSLAPPLFEEQPFIANVGGNTGSNGSRRWILGTCLGIVGGVILALTAVVTKKRLDHSRNANKKELQDRESSEETSIDHSDNILTVMTSQS